jgi:hypothetical protein
MLNPDYYINEAVNWVSEFMAGNPKTMPILTFAVGWLMKRSPTVEKVVKAISGWYIGIKGK